MRYFQTDRKVEMDRTWRASIGAFALKYDPEQPRDEIGRWTDGNDASAQESPASGSTDFSAARRRPGSESECWSQYTIDMLRCGAELRPATREICRAQAMERLAACRSGRPIPPLSY
jgi:hypothetical protein